MGTACFSPSVGVHGIRIRKYLPYLRLPSSASGLPFLPDRVGEWWSDDQQDQIDVVALGPKGQVLLGECKWGNATHQDVELLQRRRDIIARELRGIRQVHLAVFTSSPTIKDRKLAEQIKQGEVLHLCGDELLRSD